MKNCLVHLLHLLPWRVLSLKEYNSSYISTTSPQTKNSELDEKECLAFNVLKIERYRYCKSLIFNPMNYIKFFISEKELHFHTPRAQEGYQKENDDKNGFICFPKSMKSQTWSTTSLMIWCLDSSQFLLKQRLFYNWIKYCLFERTISTQNSAAINILRSKIKSLSLLFRTRSSKECQDKSGTEIGSNEAGDQLQASVLNSDASPACLLLAKYGLVLVLGFEFSWVDVSADGDEG